MDPIAPAPPPLQDDMGDETLEELGMTAEEDDEDRTTLDDDSSKEGSTELLSSQQAAKKIAAQTDAIKDRIQVRIDRQKTTASFIV